jgi:hypothetical protein
VARAHPIWYEAAQRERSQPRWRATTASPVEVVATIARALLEIEAGNRPGAQLERVCHPTL